MITCRKLLQGINKRYIQPFYTRKRREFFHEPISIISSDCSGGVLLHDYGLPLDTPTINVVIEGDYFIRFCNNLDYYLSLPLVMKEECDGYPVAYVGDVIIKGVHYISFNELNDAWNRRKNRIHRNRILFVMSERQINTADDFKHFMALKGTKICFSSKTFAQENKGATAINNFDRMFQFRGITGHRYYEEDFDLIGFLMNEGVI